MICPKCHEVILLGPGGCACTRAREAARVSDMMYEEDADLWAWLSPLPGQGFDELARRVALAILGQELFGRWPLVTEEGKLRELLKACVPPGTPKHCVTPNGRRDGHGKYVDIGPGEIRCAFCKEPI